MATDTALEAVPSNVLMDLVTGLTRTFTLVPHRQVQLSANN